ncbi:DUF1775 domain-containing protein [Mycetocola manganoxydans]|uniref:DUF1775 domain-containing protein n=1 Tax=Mycetocola manganoxydans TaxID=699879 RepID=UPI0015FF4B12|nr:DUF1775 domain-containing protein [Mycetocola manganoxydans]
MPQCPKSPHSLSLLSQGFFSHDSFPYPTGSDRHPRRLRPRSHRSSRRVRARQRHADVVDLAEPITDAHGNSLVQRVGEVVYTATTPLEDGFRDTVTLQLTLPAEAEGTAIAFPVLQTCEAGETNWSEIAADGQDSHDLAAPAPTIDVTAAEDDHSADAVGVDLAAGPTASGTAVQSEPDLVARSLGLGGLAVGLAGIVVAILSRRRPAADAHSKGSNV